MNSYRIFKKVEILVEIGVIKYIMTIRKGIFDIGSPLDNVIIINIIRSAAARK